MNIRRFASAMLVLLLALSVYLLVLGLPRWQLNVLPVVSLATAVALVALNRAVGFSVALLGLFLLFVGGVAFVIGDAEDPTLSYISDARYLWLGLGCVAFLGIAWAFKRAQSQMRSGGEF